MNVQNVWKDKEGGRDVMIDTLFDSVWLAGYREELEELLNNQSNEDNSLYILLCALEDLGSGHIRNISYEWVDPDDGVVYACTALGGEENECRPTNNR